MVLGAFMVVEDAWRRFTGFCGMRRRGHADRQGGKNPPWQKGFPARWDLGLCDLYSGDLLPCTDAGAALSYRSESLFRSGARFGLSILPRQRSCPTQPVMTPPAGRWLQDHAVIIWGQQCGLAAIRLCHDIDHDGELSASRVFNSHRFFRVVAGIPLIPVQRLFTVFRELPQQSVDSIAFPGRHRSKAAAACVSASASRIRRPMASMTLAVTLLPACLYACASGWMARMRSICP